MIGRYLSQLIHKAIHLQGWIALCALCLVWKTKLECEQWIGIGAMEGFVFFGTLAVYGLHRWRGGIKKAVGNRFIVAEKNATYLLVQSLLAFCLSGICFLFLTTKEQLVVILPAFIAVSYVLPIVGKRLRDWSVFKLVWVAGVWSWLTIILPSSSNSDLSTTVLGFVGQFCWLAALTLPFDLRDSAMDKAQNVETIPVLIGKRNTILGAILLLVLAISLTFFRFSPHNPFLYTNTLTYLYSMWVVVKSGNRTDDLFFYGLLDGMMVLSFVFDLVSSVVNTS